MISTCRLKKALALMAPVLLVVGTTWSAAQVAPGDRTLEVRHAIKGGHAKYVILFAQFIGDCSSSKWSKHVTNSPFLARLATVGFSAAYKIISACSNAVS